MTLYALPFQAVVQESSPCRQTRAFHGVALAQSHIWAGNSTLAFLGGAYVPLVKCSIQETACSSSLEGAVTVTAAFLSLLACSSWRRRAALLLVRAFLCSGRVCGGSAAEAGRGSSQSEHCPFLLASAPVLETCLDGATHPPLFSRSRCLHPLTGLAVLLSEALPARSPGLPC